MIRRSLRRFARGRDKYCAFGDAVLRSLFRLASAVCVARLTDAETFATFVVLIAVEVIATSIPNAGLLAPMASIGPGLPASRRVAFFATISRWHGYASIALGLLAFAILQAVPVAGLSTRGAGYFALYLVVAGVANGVRAREQARFRSHRVLSGDLVACAVTLTITVARADFAERVLSTYFGVQALALAVAVVWWNRIGVRRVEPVAPHVLDRLRRMGPQVAIGSVANSACVRVQPFVLGAAAGPVSVGWFGAAGSLVGPVRLLAVALSGVLRPRLALHHGSGDGAGVQRALGVAIALVLAGGGMLIAGLAVSGRAVAELVFGPGYGTAGAIAPVAALFATLEAVGAIAVVAVQTLCADGARLATRRRIAVGGLALAMVWPACAAWGAIGAFAALTVTEAVFVASTMRLLGDVLPRAAAPEPWPSR